MSLVVLTTAAAPADAQVGAAKDAVAQERVAGQEPLADKEAVVSPTAVVAETEVKNVKSLATAVQEAQAQAAEEGKVIDPADVVVPGNAAFQSTASKQSEAARDCGATPLATSKLLGNSGVVVSDEGGLLATVLLLVAAAAALVLIVVVAVKGAPTPKDRLQAIATVVAVTSGVVGLIVTFVPGVKGGDRPAEEATLAVREVHPRITRREFAQQTRTSLKGIKDIDRREVGNVIWLEINLRGYANKRPVLQYGLYRVRDEVLLDNTAKEVPLKVEDADAQTSFVPIWVGYPTDQRFQAQFRLLVDGRVRQLAKTGGMNGSASRYVCAR